MTERFASRECPAPLVLVLVHCQLDGQKAAKSQAACGRGGDSGRDLLQLRCTIAQP